MSETNTHGSRRKALNEGGARAAALEILIEVLERQAYSNLSSDAILRRYRLQPRDRAFATALVYGTISRVITLDQILSGVSSMPLAKMDAPIRNILRMGAWQLMYSRSVPPRAACNESVDLAKIAGNRGAAGMVNGILRRIASNMPSIQPENFALYYSLPSWLADSLVSWLGTESASKVAAAGIEPPPLSVRTNSLRTDPATLALKLKEEGVASSPGVFHPDALRLDLAGSPVTSLASFDAGFFMVQDEAAMMVASIAAPMPGQTVVDLCAAPGGKSCHMAEIMDNRGRIVACDLHSSRLELIGHNARRLGLTCIETRQMDASADPENRGSLPEADIVLCDVPCSGLGLLARKPDIRLNADPDSFDRLVETQRRILHKASGMIRPGGILVYSTCTLNPAENDLQADRFLQETKGKFEPCGFAPLLPERLAAMDASLVQDAAGGRIRLLPGVHGCDGFFIARFRRMA